MFYRFFDSPWFFAALLAVIILGIELGMLIGVWERRRAARRDPDGRPGEFKLGVVQNAVFGVIALLTGFTFSAASSAHQARGVQIREQADSIGEVWRRADLVDPATRTAVRTALLEYLDAEIALRDSDRHSRSPVDAEARSAAAQEALWRAVTTGDGRQPALTLSDSVNRLIQRHYGRLYTLRARTPAPMLIIVLAGVAISALLLGVSWGGAGVAPATDRPRLPARSLSGYILFTAMMALTVMVIRDLDHPFRGLLTVDESNLLDLRQWLRDQPR